MHDSIHFRFNLLHLIFGYFFMIISLLKIVHTQIIRDSAKLTNLSVFTDKVIHVFTLKHRGLSGYKIFPKPGNSEMTIIFKSIWIGHISDVWNRVKGRFFSKSYCLFLIFLPMIFWWSSVIGIYLMMQLYISNFFKWWSLSSSTCRTTWYWFSLFLL